MYVGEWKWQCEYSFKIDFNFVTVFKSQNLPSRNAKVVAYWSESCILHDRQNYNFKLISCLGTCQMRPFSKGVYFHTTILTMWCQEWLCVQKEVLEKYVTLGIVKCIYLSWASIGKMTAIISRVNVMASWVIPLAKGTNRWGWLDIRAHLKLNAKIEGMTVLRSVDLETKMSCWHFSQKNKWTN